MAGMLKRSEMVLKSFRDSQDLTKSRWTSVTSCGLGRFRVNPARGRQDETPSFNGSTKGTFCPLTRQPEDVSASSALDGRTENRSSLTRSVERLRRCARERAAGQSRQIWEASRYHRA